MQHPDATVDVQAVVADGDVWLSLKGLRQAISGMDPYWDLIELRARQAVQQRSVAGG